MPISTAGNRRRSSSPAGQRGFAYAMVLVAVVVVGILAGVANVSVSRTVQAEREQELLFRGLAYRRAIQHYYLDTGRYPRSLRELLKGSRLASHAYLRSLYVDPMSGRDGRRDSATGGWRIIRAADGGIAGVASSSPREPMKQANFPPGLERFEQARHYADWIFEYTPATSARARPF